MLPLQFREIRYGREYLPVTMLRPVAMLGIQQRSNGVGEVISAEVAAAVAKLVEELLAVTSQK